MIEFLKSNWYFIAGGILLVIVLIIIIASQINKNKKQTSVSTNQKQETEVKEEDNSKNNDSSTQLEETTNIAQEETVTQEEPVAEKVTKTKEAKYMVTYNKEERVWVVKKTGAKKASKKCATKKEALEVAEKLSEKQDLNMTVLKKNGKFQKQ